MNRKTWIAATSVVTCFGCVSLAPSASAASQKEIFSLGGGSFPQDHIYRIDLNTNTTTDLGFSGISFPTNLAMAPDRTLYYMNPFEGTYGPGHRLFSAKLNSSNTALDGPPALVADLPTSGFGIIDGMTVGPNGDLYMTGYGKSQIYRYTVATNTFSTEVTLTGGGEFRSDLAFDPIDLKMIGLGIKPGSSDRTLFQIPLSALEDGINTAYSWDYYGGSGSAWEAKALNSGSELGTNPDGIAFDPTNGDLYMSGDGTGIYPYGRVSAVRGTMLPGTGDGSLNGLGYDLAFQTTSSSINGVPGPLPIAGLGPVLAFRHRLKRRIKASYLSTTKS